MSPTVWRLALVGFSSFERSALESCLRLAAHARSNYTVVGDPEQADLLIADTDAAPVREAVREAKRLETTLAIGTHAVEGCMSQLPRPIDPLLLLRTLDGLLASRTPRAQSNVATPVPMPLPAVVPAGAVGAVDPAPTCQPSILVVDPDKLVLRFMATHLVRFGFEVRLARTGEEALKVVADQAFEFVFVERTLPGLDGWQTCKLIKQAPRRAGRRPPQVVMVAESDSRIDRMRAALAGCDGYLRKPLNHQVLMAVVGEHVVANADRVQTAYAPMTPN